MVHNELTRTIRLVRESGRMALCGYFLAGYRTPEMFYDAVRAAVRLDVVEFGIPSPNPYLDGTVIENAHRTVVRDRGLRTETALALIGGLKHVAPPRLVMTYADEGRSMRGFFRLCVQHDVHGVLAPDLPLAEAGDVAAYAASLDLAFVGFVASSMSDEEVLARAEHSAMVYLKLSGGITGSRADLESRCARLRQIVGLLRRERPEVLIAGGIGIQQPSQVADCGLLGIDMVVVGTMLVEQLHRSVADLSTCIDSLHRATRVSAVL